MRSRTRCLPLTGLVLALTACGVGRAPPGCAASRPAKRDDAQGRARAGDDDPRNRGMVRYADVTITSAAPGESIAGPLPDISSATSGVWAPGPSPEIISARICRGDAAMRTLLEARLRDAVAEGQPDASISRAYGVALHGCWERDTRCPWLHALLVDGDAPLRLGMLWDAAISCEGDAFEALFSREDTPLPHRVSWASQYARAAQRDDAEFVVGVRRLVDSDDDDPYAVEAVRRAASIVGRIEDPRAITLLGRILADRRWQSERDWLLWPLLGNPLPEARQLLDRECEDSTSPACEMRDQKPAASAPPGDDVPAGRDDVLQRLEREVLTIAHWQALSPDAQAEGLVALRTCASNLDEARQWLASRCLRRLAAVDRAAAASLAHDALQRSEHPPAALGELLTVLDRDPDGASLAAQLDALGLVDLRAPQAAQATMLVSIPLLPSEVLEARGWLQYIDLDASEDGREYHVLVDELAASSAAEMEDVLFASRETAPTAEPGQIPSAIEWELSAAVDGRRLSTRTRTHEYLYDLDAMIGLLNAVARDRGRDTRFVALRAWGSWTPVFVGPPAAAQSLVDGRVIRLEQPEGLRRKREEFQARQAAQE